MGRDGLIHGRELRFWKFFCFMKFGNGFLFLKHLKIHDGSVAN